MLLACMMVIAVTECVMAHRTIDRLVYGAIGVACVVEGITRLWRIM